MDPINVTVTEKSKSYPVYIGKDLTNHLSELLEKVGATERRFVISNQLIWKIHGQTLTNALPNVEIILIPDGERFKTLQTTSRVYDSLIKSQADRTVTIISFGGGVVGDVVGFCAATFLRGVSLVHVPTTLLAQVDSSIGGKVGVNHSLGKNLIGAFYPPIAVITDPEWLSTLPRRELRSGLYEILKYGMIANRELFALIQRDMDAIFTRDPDVLIRIITDSCRIKAEVVAADERELGYRRILNFGHTAGHAIEAVTKYRRFRHGEAVAYGMLVAANISANRKMLHSTDQQALTDVITKMGPLPPIGDISTEQTLKIIKHDKKIVSGKLHVVLPTTIGKTTIVDDVAEKEIEKALRQVGMKR